MIPNVTIVRRCEGRNSSSGPFDVRGDTTTSKYSLKTDSVKVSVDVYAAMRRLQPHVSTASGLEGHKTSIILILGCKQVTSGEQECSAHANISPVSFCSSVCCHQDSFLDRPP